MLTIFILFSAFNLSSSLPIISSGIENDRAPPVLFERALPDCSGVGRCRTLQGIVWSCVATIFACTWIAVHPNLPGPGDPASTRMKRRMFTMAYAMIAPEFVTVWALRQWIAARTIKREMNGARNETIFGRLVGPLVSIYRAVKGWWSQDPREEPREWTLTHGFFVQMGGFILYDGDTAKRVLTFNDLKRMKERKDQQEWGFNLGGWTEERKQLWARERELEDRLALSQEGLQNLQEKLESLRSLERTLESVRKSELVQVQAVKGAHERVETLRKKQTREREPRPGQIQKLSRSKWELKRELKRKTRMEQRLGRLRERLQETQWKRESRELKQHEAEELERQIEQVQELVKELQLELELRQKQLREMMKQREEWKRKRGSEWGHRTKSELAQEWEQEWNRRKQESSAFTVDADLPTISEHEMNDKGKGDFLTKLFVVIQMSWFIAQCAARWATDLPITELEIITLAFAALNIVTYIFWWKKPKDVLVAVRVQLKSGGDGGRGEAGSSANTQSEGGSEEQGVPGRKKWLSRKLAEAKKSEDTAWLNMVVYRLVQAFLRPIGKMRGYSSKCRPGSLRVPMFYAEDSGGNAYFSLLLVAVTFGAAHLIPWSFTFPSAAERGLWRLFALFLVLIPVMVYLRDLILSLNEHHPTKYSKFLAQATTSLASLGLPLYILARLGLFTLAFTVLHDPLPGVYVNVDWSTFLPHI